MEPRHTTNSTGPLQGARILVVDDAVDERSLLAGYLQQQGCRVYLATDGRDALLKVLVVKPELVLMDVSMPVCDGLSACRILKDEPATANIPVIFLTGAALPEQRVQGLRAGAIDYMTKPFDFEEVQLRLAIHLRDRSPALNLLDVSPKNTRPLDHALFIAARQYLRQDLGASIDPLALAASINCNPRRLNEAFKKCAGVTLLEYQREERMKEACRLLSETALSVQEISISLGFSTGANFATAFKDRFGASPTEFRRWQTQSARSTSKTAR